MLLHCCVVLILSAPEPKAPLSPELQELQGEWRAVRVDEKGEKWNDEETQEFVVEIQSDTLVYKRNTPFEKFRIELDSSEKPAHLDLRLIADGVDPKKLCPAIYSVDKRRRWGG
jgi:uncharacterized protein (TIGR03067 family)